MNIRNIRLKKKNSQKIIALTAYDFTFARILDEAGIDIILVGDSLGGVIYGYSSTVPVTMDDMLRHTQAVTAGAKKSLIISDMPFGSYHASIEQALNNAVSLVQKGGASGIKLEGATPFVIDVIKHMVEAGILVIGHLGFTPQQFNRIGGNVVNGREAAEAAQLKTEAIALQKAGVQMLVLEMVPEKLAEEITKSLDIPTIGIGSGRYCDGQILVLHDMLGLSGFEPKFLKKYANLETSIKKAVKNYIKDVAAGEFPAKENTY